MRPSPRCSWRSSGTPGGAVVVEVDHGQGVETHHRVHLRHERVDGGRIVHRVAGTHRCAESRQTPSPRGSTPRRPAASRWPRAPRRDTQAVPLSRGDLQHQAGRGAQGSKPPPSRIGRGPRRRGPRLPPRRLPGASRHARRPRALRGPPQPPSRGASARSPGMDGRVGRGEVDEVRRVHQEPDIPRVEARPEAVDIGQWCLPRGPPLRVVGEHLDGRCAEDPRTLGRLEQAVAGRRCGPTRRPARPARASVGSCRWWVLVRRHGAHPVPRGCGSRTPLTRVASARTMTRVSEPQSMPRRHTLREKVLHAFVVDGRLVSIPARERKRRIVLQWLATNDFEPDRDYPSGTWTCVSRFAIATWRPSAATSWRVATCRERMASTVAAPRPTGPWTRKPTCRRRVLSRGQPRGVAATHGRLDEPIVAVATSVQHGGPLALGIHEHEEVVAQLLHPRDGILFEHRLDGEPLDLDDARRRVIGRLRRRAGAPTTSAADLRSTG